MHVPRVVHACTFLGTRLYRDGLILTPSALRARHDSVAQGTDKACKQDAFVNLKVQSAQPTLSYRVGPSLGTAWHSGNPLETSSLYKQRDSLLKCFAQYVEQT